MSASYIPLADADRVVWLNNFSNRIGQYAVSLGLVPAEISSIENDAQMFSYSVMLQNTAHQYWIAVAGLKNQLLSSPQQVPAPALPAMPSAGIPPAPVNSGIFNRIILLVNRIKQSGAYTPTMGQDLNIIAPVSTITPNDMIPNLGIRIDEGHPLLKWTKGNADAVHLFVDRRDNNGFVLLAKVIRNNYMDLAEIPAGDFTAIWDYKARYLIGDDEVGQFSPVISIKVVRTALG